MNDNIFQSDWCLYELKIAIDSGVEVIIVNIENSKYGPNKVEFYHFIFILNFYFLF